ncbi:MAG: DNA alkylation repair protein, partial [Oscillospiraceae bacterium]|nr:DNA alkylation repair protein [Oscillospiraceae bacterium]
DIEYRDFNAKLIPNIDKDSIIGVRTPELRKFAKELTKSERVSVFFKTLPHQYFEENQLHAFLISEMKDYDKAIAELTRFLPYVNNWATCDQLRPKIFRKYSDRLIEEVRKWIVSDKMYTIRFGIGILMRWYLGEYFKLEYLNLVTEVRSEEYYVNMMRAWYFATALAKQYDATVRIIEENQLDTWTHNKTIQKARESYRVSNEQKEYLKTLKRMHN